jgi:hypothetical protein
MRARWPGCRETDDWAYPTSPARVHAPVNRSCELGACPPRRSRYTRAPQPARAWVVTTSLTGGRTASWASRPYLSGRCPGGAGVRVSSRRSRASRGITSRRQSFTQAVSSRRGLPLLDQRPSWLGDQSGSAGAASSSGRARSAGAFKMTKAVDRLTSLLHRLGVAAPARVCAL